MFIVYVYEQSTGSLISTSETTNTEVIISNLDTKTPYIVSVAACAKLTTRCDKFSKSINQTFSYDSLGIEALEIKNLVGNDLMPKEKSVKAQWILDTYGFNICDLSRFHIVFSSNYLYVI